MTKHVKFNINDELCAPRSPTPEPYDYEDPATRIRMSGFMKDALMSTWAVLTRPPAGHDDEPAFADSKVVTSIRVAVRIMKQSHLVGQFDLKLREGAPFISVGDIYRGINEYLNGVVSNPDLTLSNQELQGIWKSTSQGWVRRTFTGQEQSAEFLGRNRFLRGISVQPEQERWLVKLGPEGLGADWYCWGLRILIS